MTDNAPSQPSGRDGASVATGRRETQQQASDSRTESDSGAEAPPATAGRVITASSTQLSSDQLPTLDATAIAGHRPSNEAREANMLQDNRSESARLGSPTMLTNPEQDHDIWRNTSISTRSLGSPEQEFQHITGRATTSAPSHAMMRYSGVQRSNEGGADDARDTLGGLPYSSTQPAAIPLLRRMRTCSTCLSNLPLVGNFEVDERGADGAPSAFHRECLVCRKFLSRFITNGLSREEACRGLMTFLGTAEPRSAGLDAMGEQNTSLFALPGQDQSMWAPLTQPPISSSVLMSSTQLSRGGDDIMPAQQDSRKRSAQAATDQTQSMHGLSMSGNASAELRGQQASQGSQSKRARTVQPRDPLSASTLEGLRNQRGTPRDTLTEADQGGGPTSLGQPSMQGTADSAELSERTGDAGSSGDSERPAAAQRKTRATDEGPSRRPRRGVEAASSGQKDATTGQMPPPASSSNPEMRTCLVCGETKTLLGNFHRSRTFGGKQYFRAQCSRCYSVVRKERRNRRVQGNQQAAEGSAVLRSSMPQGTSNVPVSSAPPQRTNPAFSSGETTRTPMDSSGTTPAGGLGLLRAIAHSISPRGVLDSSSSWHPDTSYSHERQQRHPSPRMQVDHADLHRERERELARQVSSGLRMPSNAGRLEHGHLGLHEPQSQDPPASMLAGRMGSWGRGPGLQREQDVSQTAGLSDVHELAQRLLARSQPLLDPPFEQRIEQPQALRGLSDSALLACAIDTMFSRNTMLYPSPMQRLQLADMMMAQQAQGLPSDNAQQHQMLSGSLPPTAAHGMLSSSSGAAAQSLGLGGLQQAVGHRGVSPSQWDARESSAPLPFGIASDEWMQRQQGRRSMPGTGSPSQQPPAMHTESMMAGAMDIASSEGRMRGRRPTEMGRLKVCEICGVRKPVEGYFSEHSKSQQGTKTTYRRQCKGCFVLLKRLYRRGQTWSDARDNLKKAFASERAGLAGDADIPETLTTSQPSPGDAAAGPMPDEPEEDE